MEKIAEALDKGKMEIKNINAPDELEERLRGALSKTPRRKGKRLIAAALILFLLSFYSYDAIAYYGRKIMGYDNTTYGNIKELNEKGRGQEINKSCRFSDGTEVKLDGIIFDDNKLIAFVKVTSKEGFDKLNLTYSIKGLRFIEYLNSSGTGNFNEERNEINWTLEFDPPAIYEKWLSLEVTKLADGKAEEGKIGFELDRNKAMGHTVKQDINKEIGIGDKNIKFNKITISPIAAVIDGEITGGASFNGDFLAGGNTDHPLVDFDLIINGEVYNCSTRNMRGSNNKIEFQNESVAVPSVVNTLKIGDIKYATERLVDKKISIKPETKELKVDTEKGNIIIKNVRQDNKSTYITIKSDVEFDIKNNPVLNLVADGKDITSTEQVLDREYDEGGKRYRERTFRFDTLGEKLELCIKVVYDIIYSSEVIDIPVGK